ncbi:hypothetical protein [Actinoplanes friuliensis]|jgi:hypothetical protein|uniref:Uncharacterized protein n=1 Tax=Actinoplanes friuliensis DSM 7358 TaxID=1246995 RepID=U5W2P5_9ACTN|nr:hypothetical protein [Actinoplanes friuliensis]AGZ42255.1 hypothetical protein AFR_19915 [Actinoplanes friuliensis DSM 7358]
MTEQNTPSPRRTAVWALLILCAVGNVIVSLRGASLVVHLVLGIVTVACIVALVVPYVRRTR